MFDIIYMFWNIFVFALYGLDKKRAYTHGRRINERMFIAMAFCLGAIGSIVGMLVFWHKIYKPRYVMMILLALAVNIFMIAVF